MPLHRLLLLFILLTSSIISCRKKDDPEPSPTLIVMEAEGGSESVKLGSDGWQIAGVVNKSGGQRIFGDIYTPDGQKVRENSLLELDGPGRLEGGLGFDRGFSIEYDQEEIRVTLLENSMDDVFSFAIVLKKGDETKEITIEQKVSQGYTFRDITYSVEDGDGDSLYVKNGTRYEFNLTSPRQVSVSPFGGVDILRIAYFKSDEGYNGFAMRVRDDSIVVPVPLEISDGSPVLSAPRDLYGVSTSEPYNSDIVAVVDVPAGGASFRSKQEWRCRRVSYRLTLTNNRTGELREITGKWIEQAPTGRYEIVKDF